MSITAEKEPIAICGYGFRLPGGLETEDDYFNLLAERRYVQEPIEDRYGKGAAILDGTNTTSHPNANASIYEGLIKDGKELEFDCTLFGISSAEAKRMDPQMKLMLSCTWEALQHAGMDQVALHNSNTGVYIGAQDAAAATWRSPLGASPADGPGKPFNMIANRISYHFNWMGPSYAVGTACSSSIYALDAAMNALRSGKIGMAAVGGVTYLGSFDASTAYSMLGIFSPTGTCRSFDKDANGYMRSEGAFMFLLKRLSDAERDGDKIFAVVRGCDLNAAGAEPEADVLTAGRMIVAPTQNAQERLFRSVLEETGINPFEIDYVEAHATGTSVGDAIEGNSIASVFGSKERDYPLRLASARSNLGHMEAASFTGSLLKVMLMFQRKKFLPISSHFKEPNPKIPFKEQKMVVLTTCEDFPVGREAPVRIGVNSFGFGGANGHCIIEEYRPSSPKYTIWSNFPVASSEGMKVYSVPLSAKSEEALLKNAKKLADSLEYLSTKMDFQTLVANLSVRMTHLRIRTSFQAVDWHQLKEQLDSFVHRGEEGKLEPKEISKLEQGKVSGIKNVAMVFPGQGSQWAGCGRELYETEPVFRRVVDVIDEEWTKLSGHKLSPIAFDEDIAAEVLNKCENAQPVTFMLEVGLLELLKSHGVYPSVVVGHSAGEPAAAYASGAYKLEEACRIVYHRARLQEKLSGSGRMLVLMQSRQAVDEMLVRLGFEKDIDGKTTSVHVACLNSPHSTVVCGDSVSIARLQEALKNNEQDPGKLIPGSIAFHSPFMDPIQEELLEALEPLDSEVEKHFSSIPFVSTVTGTVQRALNAYYWWKNVREPVNLVDAVANIRKHVRPDAIIEVSPHITLRSPIRDCYTQSGDEITEIPPYIYTLVRRTSSSQSFARAVGDCFRAGVRVNFRSIYPRPEPMTHFFPPYSMKKDRMIDELSDDKLFIGGHRTASGPLLGHRMQTDSKEYQALMSSAVFPWLVDHRVQNTPIFPGAGYVELLLEAFKGKPLRIRSRFETPLILKPDAVYLITSIVPKSIDPTSFDFKVSSGKHDREPERTAHCSGYIDELDEREQNFAIPTQIPVNLSEIDDDFGDVLFPDQESFYDTMAGRVGENFTYGPTFQGVKRVERSTKTKRLRLQVALDQEKWKQWDDMGYIFHPALLDGAIQSGITNLMECVDFNAVAHYIDMIFLKKPSSHQITVIHESTLLQQLNDKGQPMIPLGEVPSGKTSIYDAGTGTLIAYISSTAYSTNARKTEMRRTMHTLTWQPKNGCDAITSSSPGVRALAEGHGLAEAVKLLINEVQLTGHPESGTPFFVNAGEFIIGKPPDELAVRDCLDVITDAPVQYSIVDSDSDYLKSLYKELGVKQDASLRFIESKDYGANGTGFLRPGMFDLLALHITECDRGANEIREELSRLMKLLSPGGLMLVQSICALGEIMPEGGLDCLCKAAETEKNLAVFRQSSSLKGSAFCGDQGTYESLAKEAWVIVDDDCGFSKCWRDSTNSKQLPSSADFEEASKWQRVDYFAMINETLDVSADSSEEELFDPAARLVEWVQKFAAMRTGDSEVAPCRFMIFTSGAVVDVTSPKQTAIWGATRSMIIDLANQCKTEFRLIDVTSMDDLGLVQTAESMRERELCIKNGQLWASRLLNDREPRLMVRHDEDEDMMYHLHHDNSGTLAHLHFRSRSLPPLGENDVEIEIKASSLNFRDIMVGLGRLPLLSYERSYLGPNIGSDCAGVIVRSGPAVKRLKVGDRVVTCQGGCIANRIRIHELGVFRLPDSLSFEQGASIPTVYMTAYYGLVHLAHMRQGHAVLVHSGMGGVGQAAIALAKLKGATIYSTAGSEEKRQALREMGCKAVFDSHSYSWYKDLMTATGGRGVDMILNSLAGKHVDLCLEALAPCGWHLEIGKVDIYSDRPMRMCVFRKNLRFIGIDMDRLFIDEPRTSVETMHEVFDFYEAGKLPPLPYQSFSYKDHQSALRLMMKGQHWGKVVLTPPSDGMPPLKVVDERHLFRTSGNRTILLSGCLGGFGLRTFSYVVSQGAKHIVLLDRDKTRRRSVEWLCEQSHVEKQEGLRVEIVYADVSNYGEVEKALCLVEEMGFPPIGSVFHLAGVLDDKSVSEIDRKSFSKVFGPKANGAWNLHRATLSCNTIEHFVMLSSISSVLGNQGQTSYSAANAFQDGLADYRRKQGLPALSFCMGAVAEAGMLARNGKLLQVIRMKGMPAISCIFAIDGLDSALRSGQHSNAVAALVDFPKVDPGSSDFLRSLGQLVRNKAVFQGGNSGEMTSGHLIEVISNHVAELCGVEEIDPSEPLSSYGLNSMSVSELVLFLSQDMSYNISPMELMTSATVESIVQDILSPKRRNETSTSGEESKEDGSEKNTEETDDRCGSDDEELWKGQEEAEVCSRFALSLNDHFPEGVFNTSAPDTTLNATAPSHRKVEVSQKDESMETFSDKRNCLKEVKKDDLPRECKEMLDEILSFVDSIDVSTLLAPSRVESIGCVLLTGATGFIGRHFLADLLKSSQGKKIKQVYCLVRTKNNAEALERVIDAMKEAGTWNESYHEQICALASDMEKPFMGLSAQSYEKLVTDVEAVYHFAAQPILWAPFNVIYRSNCLPMKEVIRFCLSTKQKHLFYTSTLGIFPQYFCRFGNEMAEKPVERDAMPDLSLMKKIFPLATSGYPWSKLINEIVTLEAAATKGLPLAVFRLPVTYVNSSTGFTVASDPLVRLLLATRQVKCIPEGLRQVIYEDADWCIKTMIGISFNPSRTHVIYNCSNEIPSLIVSECPTEMMAGIDYQPCSYKSFKAKCILLGKESVLHGYWMLVDHFSRYWVDPKRFAEVSPIDVTTVQEDCPNLPRTSDIIQTQRSSMNWIVRHPENWPIEPKLMSSSFKPSVILKPAVHLCEKYNMDFETVVPARVQEALQRVCCEMKVPLQEQGHAAFHLTSRLESRVHLRRLIELRPEIRQEEIRRPIFIVGLHRTGTTALHRLLESSGCFGALHLEEQYFLPSAENIIEMDPEYEKRRVLALQSTLQGLQGMDASILGQHLWTTGVAEEDFCAHQCNFTAFEFDFLYDLPKYREWLDAQELEEVYQEHREWIQYISWSRRRTGRPVSRWCFKMPVHARYLPALLKAYPDAVLVHTHRDPTAVAGSMCALVESGRRVEIHRHSIGEDVIKLMENTLQASMKFRQDHPELKNRWLDLHFNDIVANPVSAAKKVFKHSHERLDGKIVKRMAEFARESREKHSHLRKLYSYDISTYGISESRFTQGIFKEYRKQHCRRRMLRHPFTTKTIERKKRRLSLPLLQRRNSTPNDESSE